MANKIYFGADVTEKYYLDTEKTQWIEYKKMTEGQRRQYEAMTSQPIIINQLTQEMKMDSRVGEDRKALFDTAVIGYKIFWGNEETIRESHKNNGQWPSPSEWEEVRDAMSSDISQALMASIIELNPWILPTGKKK